MSSFAKPTFKYHYNKSREEEFLEKPDGNIL